MFPDLILAARHASEPSRKSVPDRYHRQMTQLRVVLDTNVFTPQHFDLIDKSPMRELCRRGQIVPIYSGPFFEETARAYMRDKVRDALLSRWLPFICETGGRFHEDLPTIWHREVVRGTGRKVLTYMKPRVQQEMIGRIRALPPDGSWDLIRETERERRADADRLIAQREISKQMRVEVAEEVRARGLKHRRDDVAEVVKRGLVALIGRGMIERHLGCWNWRAVANRWERNPASYRYFTQFVENMTYKEVLFLTDPSAPIDINAQPDLDLMTFLLDADVFVTNEKGFARRAFQDLWKPRGRVIFSSEEFAKLLHAM